MVILLFGIGNVGKTTLASVLAKQLGYQFIDIDEEVENTLQITIDDFIDSYSLIERDKYRASLAKKAVNEYKDVVIAVTPTTYIQFYDEIINRQNVLCFELTDQAENILARLAFTDENGQLYHDPEYVQKHRRHYLKLIKEDQDYFGNVFKGRFIKIEMNGRIPEEIAIDMIQKHGLDKNQ